MLRNCEELKIRGDRLYSSEGRRDHGTREPEPEEVPDEEVGKCLSLVREVVRRVCDRTAEYHKDT